MQRAVPVYVAWLHGSPTEQAKVCRQRQYLSTCAIWCSISQPTCYWTWRYDNILKLPFIALKYVQIGLCVHVNISSVLVTAASRLFWLTPTFLCCLCTGCLEQYTCFHLRFWHIGHFQNCSKNTPLQLRLYVVPLTAIHWRLRFTPSWFVAPTKEISVIDSLNDWKLGVGINVMPLSSEARKIIWDRFGDPVLLISARMQFRGCWNAVPWSRVQCYFLVFFIVLYALQRCCIWPAVILPKFVTSCKSSAHSAETGSESEVPELRHQLCSMLNRLYYYLLLFFFYAHWYFIPRGLEINKV